MSIYYDHHTQRIRVPHTRAEYLQALGSTRPCGIHLYAAIDDRLDYRVQFRHEHAHFASFQATGLAELQAIFSDYKLFLFHLIVRHFYQEGSGKLRVPLIRRHDASSELNSLIGRAIKQINQQESLFFGYGTNASIDELFSTHIQEELVKKLSNGRSYIVPNMMRYRKFLRQMRFATDPTIAMHPDAASVFIQFGESEKIRVSSRSVQEAYAITIEVISEYIKAIFTSLNSRGSESKRMPPKSNTVAITYILSAITDTAITLKDYVFGRAGARIYWAVALVALAAMQVPVMEDLEGEPIAMGSLKQLSPATRLGFILKAIESGTIPNPLKTYGQQDHDVLRWLDQAHSAIGDPWSLKFYMNIAHIIHSMPDEYRTKFKKFSMHKTSWAARSNFVTSPKDWIMEAGFFTENSPVQIRYIQTSDGSIITDAEPDVAQDQLVFEYLVDCGIHILEAMIFDDKWHSDWDKVGPNYSDVEQIAGIKAALIMYVFPGNANFLNDLQVEIAV